MSLPTVEVARATMRAAVRTLSAEAVPLAEADGRRLAEPVLARRDQPPFDASAMDGWAVRASDVAAGARPGLDAPIAQEFVAASGCSTIGTAFLVFSGSATGKRHTISGNAVVDSFGASFIGGSNSPFPGNSDGTTPTGGQLL